MEIGLELRQEMALGPWYWNLPNDEMRNNFKDFLTTEKGYKLITEKSRTGIMMRYFDAIADAAEADGVTWAFVGVNVDDYIAKCDKANKVLYKALRLYKEFVS